MVQSRSLTMTFALCTVVGILGCGGDSEDEPDSPVGPDEAAPVATVEVTPSTLNLQIGDTSRLAATLRDGEGQVLTDRDTEWSSEDPDIVQVSSTGLVTAVGGGTTGVFAVAEEVADTATVDVQVQPPAAGEVAWSFQLEGRMPDGSTPAVAPDGTIYVVTVTPDDRHFLYSLTSNGSLRWREDLGEDPFLGWDTPMLGPDGTVYAKRALRDEHNNRLRRAVALDRDGNERWHLDHQTPAAAMEDGTVYFHGALWIRDPDGTVRLLSEESHGAGHVRAVLSDGSVLATGGSLAVLIGPDGALRWSYENPPGDGSVPGHTFDPMHYVGVAVDRDASIVFTSSTQEHAQRTFRLSSSGQLLWQRDWRVTSDCLRVSPPVIGPDGTIYVARLPFLSALAPDGSTKWQYNLEGGQEAAPAVASDGTIYGALNGRFDHRFGNFHESGAVYALNQEGHLQWGEVGGETGPCRYTNLAITPSGLVLVPEEGNTRLAAYVGDGPLASGVWPKANGDAGNTASR